MNTSPNKPAPDVGQMTLEVLREISVSLSDLLAAVEKATGAPDRAGLAVALASALKGVTLKSAAAAPGKTTFEVDVKQIGGVLHGMTITRKTQ